jgi:hypothetical protein
VPRSVGRGVGGTLVECVHVQTAPKTSRAAADK